MVIHFNVPLNADSTKQTFYRRNSSLIIRIRNEVVPVRVLYGEEEYSFRRCSNDGVKVSGDYFRRTQRNENRFHRKYR